MTVLLADLLRQAQTLPIGNDTDEPTRSTKREEWPQAPVRHRNLAATSCICRGYGWYKACDCPYQDIMLCPDFGVAFPCVCNLQKFAGTFRQRIREECGLTPSAQRDYTMHTFYPDQHEDAEAMFLAAAAYLTGDSKPWLVMLGSPGAGKSHLAMAITNGMIAQGVEARFITASRLMDRMRCADMGWPDPYDDQMYSLFKLAESFAKVPVLVLDDIRFDLITTESQMKYLERVIEPRYDDSAPTVITSNNLEVKEIGARWHSRLLDRKKANVLFLAPPDQRVAA
jgi:hypothetical protein